MSTGKYFKVFKRACYLQLQNPSVKDNFLIVIASEYADITIIRTLGNYLPIDKIQHQTRFELLLSNIFGVLQTKS